MFINKSFKSSNFDERSQDRNINLLVIHDTRMFSSHDAINRLCSEESKVSCHYLIAKDGEVFNLVDESKRAWHAGESFWSSHEKLNDCSIGIELDNKGDEYFTEQQYKSLSLLAKEIIVKYQIKPVNVLGHSDIAPWRKLDPNSHFSWLRLHEDGIGLYSKAMVKSFATITHYGDRSPVVAELKKNLSKLGYRILNNNSDFDLELLQVVHAFKKHHVPETMRTTFWDELSEVRLKDLLAKL